ncbi:MAG: succinate dehydrogenase, cytochrome b556 subunit [Gammaproteobacteria bacterium]|jgi:succinate dehydrogenase / fumarate reductase cytochrome b subunit|nr:succinate dehydrogenase, cytochrome b556 subunit [Gammaproteobacteria bacterium]
MTTKNRPLSPHLQVYRWQITMVMSILHRATGIALALGSLVLVYWLASLASGPAAYADAQALLGSNLARVLLGCVSFAFFYHLSNGVRHLVWDTGRGFEISQLYRSGYLAVAASIVLTAGFWLLVL